jgi:hypothetical protein
MISNVRIVFVAAALSGCATTSASGGAAAVRDTGPALPATVPAALTPPPGETLSLSALGVGVQIYDCKAAPTGGYAWVFRAPEATLSHGPADKDPASVGKHYAGPTWADGAGSVAATVSSKEPSPDASAIPWLRLTASGHTGSGRFADISTVLRLNTVGGKAPATGCDEKASGQESRVPYRADYFFYRPAAPAK